LVTGLATGYYLGARAGRQRYDQINRTIARVRRTDAYEEAVERAKAVAAEAAEKAREVIDEGVEKARAAVSRSDSDDGHTNGSHTNGSHANGSHAYGSGADAEITTAGVILPTDPPIGPGGYSSSR